MGRLPIQVEVIIFRVMNDSYEYLLLKRIAAKGGFWQPVTGGLEEGEELRDAVIREVKEETGIIQFKRIINNVYQFNFGDDIERKEYVFGLEVSSDELVALDKNVYVEHDEIKWCSFDEAMLLLKWSGNKEGLRKLNGIIRGD